MISTIRIDSEIRISFTVDFQAPNSAFQFGFLPQLYPTFGDAWRMSVTARTNVYT